MITAEFWTQDGAVFQVEVSGHADFAEHGQDIVCAAVTSALQLTANGISHVLRCPTSVSQEENRVRVTLDNPGDKNASQFLSALELHLSVLAEDYPENIKILLTEV